MEFQRLLIDVLTKIHSTRFLLGDRAAEEVQPTARGKRQSRLEEGIISLLFMETGERGLLHGLNVVAEGNDPIKFPGAAHTMYVDPVDGTAGFARSIESGVETSDPATVISIVSNREVVTFGEVVASGGLNLRSGQMWIAADGEGALVGQAQTGWTFARIEPIRLYNRHSPLLASEFYRLINRLTMFLINQPVEWSDFHSSFLNILQVPLGKADCFFNNVLPDVSNEGQRGHELGAIMPFLKEVQGYAMDTHTMRPLEETPFTFDGMTPVVIGVDKATIRYYWKMIQENLYKRIVVADRDGDEEIICEMSAREVIGLLYKTISTQRWSLRPLAE